MPDTLPTIGGNIADALNLSDAEVTDVLNGAPFVSILGSEESSDGTLHQYAKEISAPVVGFRAPNTGRFFSTDSDQLVTIELKVLDWSFLADKAVADSWRKGGSEAFLLRKGARHLRSALFTYERQVFYGGSADAAGFVGIADILNFIDDDGMVVDGGGDAGALTSVFAVRLGDNDVKGVYKGDGILDVSEPVVQNTKDSNGKNYPAWYVPACTWIGLQVGSAFSFGRIANLGKGEGETLNDDLIYELFSRFPEDRPPTHYVMNSRSLEQLRKSRTATNATGAPAPTPTEVGGIPIIATGSIHNNETAVEVGSLS